MSNCLIARNESKNRTGIAAWLAGGAAALGLAVWIAGAGCANTSGLPQIPESEASDANATNTLTLHEGDVIQVVFPNNSEWSGPQTIRADGKITIQSSEVKVSGLTPEEAGTAILAAVGKNLKLQQVNVTVQSSAFIVYVTGAIARPGKLISDRPITVLEAVMESGIDSARSDLKHVEIIRAYPNGQYKYKFLDLAAILNASGSGPTVKPFTLKAYDTIVIKEKFNPL
jgi:protein involved in polysaccharide export with SLBB domain